MADDDMTTISVKRSTKQYMRDGKPDGLAWWKFIETVYIEWVDAPPEYRSIDTEP